VGLLAELEMEEGSDFLEASGAGFSLGFELGVEVFAIGCVAGCGEVVAEGFEFGGVGFGAGVEVGEVGVVVGAGERWSGCWSWRRRWRGVW